MSSPNLKIDKYTEIKAKILQLEKRIYELELRKQGTEILNDILGYDIDE
jgi:hypothetical protein